jgi:hypothetical protein
LVAELTGHVVISSLKSKQQWSVTLIISRQARVVTNFVHVSHAVLFRHVLKTSSEVIAGSGRVNLLFITVSLHASKWINDKWNQELRVLEKFKNLFHSSSL